MWTLIVPGYLLTIASWGWLTGIAFKESAGTGLLFIGVPFYAVYYIVSRWEKARVPAAMHLTGWIVIAIAL